MNSASPIVPAAAAEEIKYVIDDRNVHLIKVTRKIRCRKCENILILENDGVYLIKKSMLTIVDMDRREIVYCCRYCKSYWNLGPSGITEHLI